MDSDWRAALTAALPRVRLDEPLARHTTYKIGGPADALAEPSTREELSRALSIASESRVPVFVLGFGSNLLVKDRGIRGLVIRLSGDFERIDFPGGARVRAGAAVRIPQLVVACAQRGLSGLEPIVGVPGTVGGALAMNAGTREAEIGALVESVELARPSGEIAEVPASALRFSYRHSSIENAIALSAALVLKARDKADIMADVARHQQKRLQTQPIHTFNVGSTFKNPPGRFAAELIERAGLKGHAVGGARVSPVHANFIENFAGAKASDVLALVDLIRERVRAAFGVGLELEMKVVGE